MADTIDRLHSPYKLYKPLWLNAADLYSLKRDLDREFESISQSLLYVTQQLDTIKEAELLLLRVHRGELTNTDVQTYLDKFDYDKSASATDKTKWKTLWPKVAGRTLKENYNG